MKKQIVFYCLLVAFVIQLFHNVVPHTHFGEHHHGDKHHHHHEHGQSHSHDNNDEDKSISLLFSHLNHTSESFVSFHENSVQKSSSQFSLDLLNNSYDYQFNRPISFYYPQKLKSKLLDNRIRSPHLTSLKFRGPPSFS